MKTSFHVLLVEDDALIAKTLSMNLSYKGFHVTACNSFRSGIAAWNSASSGAAGKFDLILLDINLPDGNGMDLCRKIKTEDSSTPVLMLTAKADEETAVKSLEIGADDYIRKPYGTQELVARMNRLIDRKSKTGDLLTFGKLKVSLKKRLAWIGESQLSLGKREFEILALLIKKSGDVVTRDEILTALGEESEIYDRTIDSHLSHLRRKLKDAANAEGDAVQITPVYGVGYRLEVK